MGKREVARGKRKKKLKYYVERDSHGRFKKFTRIGRSLRADRRTKAKTIVKSGYGHLGDHKIRKKKKK